MCSVCGCNKAEVTSDSMHKHAHQQSSSRLLEIEQNILAKNNYYAERNRQQLQSNGIFALNFVSSPGAGKTTLLTEIINQLKDQHAIYVIEGDQQTALDAARIRETGVKAMQINTGKGCHLDAHMVGHACKHLDMHKNAFLFIENVGNLICPAGFDLGEAHKIVILSVTEGEDKPLKYPEIFHAAELMIINKTDLLPHLNFAVQECCEYAKQINPDIDIIQLCATSGENIEQFGHWLIAGKAQFQSANNKHKL